MSTKPSSSRSFARSKHQLKAEALQARFINLRQPVHYHQLPVKHQAHQQQGQQSTADGQPTPLTPNLRTSTINSGELEWDYESLLKNSKPSYNQTTASKHKSGASLAQLPLVLLLSCAMVLSTVGLAVMFFLYPLIQTKPQPQQLHSSPWRYTRTGSTGMLLMLVFFTPFLTTSNGYELLSGSMPYEIGKKVHIHGKDYAMPEMHVVTKYQKDVTCAADVVIDSTTGVECSPITDGVVKTGEWKYWKDKKVGKNAHYRECSYYKTTAFEYGCMLGSHQHCLALKAIYWRPVHLAHRSDYVLKIKDQDPDVDIIPEQEYDMPHLAAYDSDGFYENSESYTTYAYTACFVTITNDEPTFHPDMMSIKYDLASMHWSTHHPTLKKPTNTQIEAIITDDGCEVELPSIPRTVRLKYHPPEDHSSCSLSCFKSSKGDYTTVNEYHGDNVVTVLAEGQTDYCELVNADRTIYVKSGRRERIGVSHPLITSGTNQATCPYIKVVNWQEHSRSESSDYQSNIIDLTGIFTGLDKYVMVIIGLVLVYVAGPSVVTLVVFVIIMYSAGFIHSADALPVSVMHRCENLSITVEILMMMSQFFLGSSMYTWAPSLISGFILVAVYPYRSERVNLIAAARLFVSSSTGSILYRAPVHLGLTMFRHSPKLHQKVKEAMEKAREAKDFVEIRTSATAPVIRAHSVDGAIARIKVMQRQRGLTSCYFINRNVIRKVVKTHEIKTRMPYMAVSHVRQVSGLVFYPEEYEILRKHIKKMSTVGIIGLKSGATWVHGREKWDFTEVIPYAPNDLAWAMAALSTR